jgi:hypothetical protein
VKENTRIKRRTDDKIIERGDEEIENCPVVGEAWIPSCISNNVCGT